MTFRSVNQFRRGLAVALAALLIVIGVAGGIHAQENTPPAVVVQTITLAGPASEPDAEISGLAWYGDTLLLVAENPNIYATSDYAGMFYALHKADILAYLDAADPAPLEPFAVPVIAPDIKRTIRGFDGFEAAVFAGDRVYMAIEVWLSQAGDMRGYLVAGDVTPDLGAITLDLDHPLELLPQTDIQNLSYETLLLDGDRLIVIYEANGAEVNPQPVAYSVDLALTTATPIPLPSVPYRLTDATAPDADGLFWAVNFFFPGDTELFTEHDPLPRLDALLPARVVPVERLVAFQLAPDRITLADQPPILLEPLDGVSRNWEGIARLDDRGFLIVTDKYPQTILGFVPVSASD